MSGGVAFVSSCAQDDDSDRGEDQDYVPSFVVTVTAGDEVVSRRFDDTHNNGDSEGDSMLMSQQPAGSRTPCMADDVTETERQWKQYIAHYKGQGTASVRDSLCSMETCWGARRVAETGKIRRCLARPIPW